VHRQRTKAWTRSLPARTSHARAPGSTAHHDASGTQLVTLPSRRSHPVCGEAMWRWTNTRASQCSAGRAETGTSGCSISMVGSKREEQSSASCWSAAVSRHFPSFEHGGASLLKANHLYGPAFPGCRFPRAASQTHGRTPSTALILSSLARALAPTRCLPRVTNICTSSAPACQGVLQQIACGGDQRARVHGCLCFGEELAGKPDATRRAQSRQSRRQSALPTPLQVLGRQEHAASALQLPKLNVVGSNPIGRSISLSRSVPPLAPCAPCRARVPRRRLGRPHPGRAGLCAFVTQHRLNYDTRASAFHVRTWAAPATAMQRSVTLPACPA